MSELEDFQKLLKRGLIIYTKMLEALQPIITDVENDLNPMKPTSLDRLHHSLIRERASIKAAGDARLKSTQIIGEMMKSLE